MKSNVLNVKPKVNKNLDDLNCLGGEPSDFTIRETDFSPVSHIVEKLNFESFMDHEEVGALVVGCALDCNRRGKDDSSLLVEFNAGSLCGTNR